MKIKQLKLQAKQAGFTLLELLVVITLIAALAVGALIAYDGVGDKAQAAAAADANVKVDNAIRQYKAVTNSYPNQWDNLASGASLISALPTQLTAVISTWATGNAASNVTFSLGRAGINELQQWNSPDAGLNTTGVIPNLAHNESFNPQNAQEQEHFEDNGIGDDGPIANIAVVPGLTGCQADGVALPITPADVNFPAGDDNYIQNRYSDALEGDECHLVVALGFGSDAAASTATSSVSIGKSPSFGKTDAANPANNVDPNQHYSRYIGLFLVGSDGDDAGTDITDGEYLTKARLLTIIAPDGTIADQNLATAVQN
ncbi:type II secretion system protein [Methylomonas rivi]|uniref:Type II secretion system GspH family protein n=1 Tax=Methylomonas rivi TaxID=2952226 RepID=A0ABT1UAQ3_9GAMM|nr:type II secretion system protein [Methylomonas sp. WSC-6]MCQ8130943.1 type II secretion system GspH family protein [Methylomonas sp. WSC-6]